jgi:hypothetical protein
LKKVKLDEEFKIKSGQEENKTIEKEISSDVLKKGSVERSLASIMAKEESEKNDIEYLKDKIKNIIGTEKFKDFEKEYKDKANELAFEAEGYYGPADEKRLQEETEYLLLNLREEYFKKELEKLLTDLKKAEKEKTAEMISSISIRLKEIMEKLSEIRAEKNNFYKK